MIYIVKQTNEDQANDKITIDIDKSLFWLIKSLSSLLTLAKLADSLQKLSSKRTIRYAKVILSCI